MRSCPLRRWHGLFKPRLLARLLVSRPKMLACVAVLAGATICCTVYLYIRVNGWLRARADCKCSSYSFITENSDIDLQIELALRRSVNGSWPSRFQSQVHDSPPQMTDPGVPNKREVDHNCKLLDDSRGPLSARNASACKPCARRLPISAQQLLKSGQVVPNTTSVSREELESKYTDMEDGGRWRPRNCLPLQRLAVIVPYRNRLNHLNVLLNNLIPFCRRQQADVTFFVIEQESSTVFNRGALLNVGFLEADKQAEFDCFIFHDVDLIPLNDRNMYRCGDNPRHFAVALNKYGYSLLYEGYFGGVVGFTRQQYLDINGNSNLYFGWGGEDDDLVLRSMSRGYYVSRYSEYTARYDMISHNRDPGNEINPHRKTLLGSAIQRQQVEGLSTTKYKVIHKDFQHLYTWITVALNFTHIVKTAPEYTLAGIHRDMDILATRGNHACHTALSTWPFLALLVLACCCSLLTHCDKFFRWLFIYGASPCLNG